MRLVFALLLLLVPAAMAHARTRSADSLDARHFRVYTGTGAPASLAEVVEAMADVEVVFVGEEHDDTTAHRLQLELLQRVAARSGAEAPGEGRPLALSLEMFDRDVQPILDEYLAGLITEEHFLQGSRPWQNYGAAYRPLVEFARAHGLPVLAANAPRRYVNRVSRLGAASLAELPPAARRWLAPLPFEPPSEAYRARWHRLMAEMQAGPHGGGAKSTPADSTAATAHAPPPAFHSGMERLLEAQALWDATMAYTIASFLLERPQALVLHLVGGFHVEGGLGTPEHLRRYRPGTRLLVVAIRPADRVEAFDAARFAGLGDFVILTAEAAEAGE